MQRLAGHHVSQVLYVLAAQLADLSTFRILTGRQKLYPNFPSSHNLFLSLYMVLICISYEQALILTPVAVISAFVLNKRPISISYLLTLTKNEIVHLSWMALRCICKCRHWKGGSLVGSPLATRGVWCRYFQWWLINYITYSSVGVETDWTIRMGTRAPHEGRTIESL